MMRYLGPGALAAVVSMAAPSAAQAIELDYVGARAGLLGYGGEVGVSIIPSLSVRGVYNTGTLSFDNDLDGVNYEGDVELSSYGAIVDFKPIPLFPVYASVGYFLNSNEISATALNTSGLTIGDVSYNATQITGLRGGVTFDDAAPYAGLGMRFTLIKIQVNVEAGAFMQGAPQLSLAATGGTLANDSAFRTELAKEVARAQDDIDNYEVYPVVNVGLRYKF